MFSRQINRMNTVGTAGGVLLAVVMGVGSVSVAQETNAMPDAQVEANVLKALASAPELSNESIRTTTVYGTVTLSGAVTTEEMRTKAENLAANAKGVKKVVDELTLGAPATAGAAPMQATTTNSPQPMNGGDSTNGGTSNMVLQSDGTMVPADQANGGNNSQPAPAPAAPQQAAASPAPAPPVDNRRPIAPPQGPYGYAQPAPYAPYGGQQAGLTVVIPAGAMLRIRVNQRLSSNKSQPGSVFDGVVVNDVVAGNEVAIPRGAQVRGTVIDAKASGALAGRGELSLQLTQITLGAKTYNVTSEVWAHNGADKTVETVNKTAGFGALGALLGAAAGGGAGAAIGGGIGAASGIASSASSGRGQVIVPSEGILNFKLAQQVAVVTVSEQEMQRLAYGVPYGAQPSYPPPPPRYRPYYAPYPY